MTSLSSSRRARLCVGATAVVTLAGVWAAASPRVSASTPAPAVATTASHAVTAPTKAQLLNPAKKYYGISVAGAPYSLSAVDNVTKETGKQPNLLMVYQAWNGNAASGVSNVDTKGLTAACQAGLLPELTWESWNTSTHISSNPGVAYTQPAFSMSKIVSGTYDTYIKATAKAIASIPCPVIMRFDQEENGYWYPWGISNTDQNGSNTTATADEYIKMWRYVYNKFQNNGASNVLWMWSPNNQKPNATHLPAMGASYPGNSYVDLVGLDQYISAANETFKAVFDPQIKQLNQVAKGKPWLVGETAVGSYADKAAEMTNLLHAVAARKRFIGLVYFDQHKSTDRSNWLLDETSASLAAFKAGINSSKYAAGKPGEF